MRFGTARWLFGLIGLLGCTALAACTALLDTASLSSGGAAGLDGSSGAGAASGSGDVGGTSGAGAGGAAGSSGAGGVAGSGGAGGVAGSGGVSASAGDGGAAGAPDCIPSSDPTEYCDGIDNDCDPTTPDMCPSRCIGKAYAGTGYMACADAHSWDLSEARCQAQAMHLVRIDSAMENAFVLSLGKPLAQRVWIGASDEASDGTFSWIGGPTLYAGGAPVTGVFHFFSSGQPLNRAAADCLEIYTSSSNTEGEWFDDPCTSNEPFICERY